MATAPNVSVPFKTTSLQFLYDRSHRQVETQVNLHLARE